MTDSSKYIWESIPTYDGYQLDSSDILRLLNVSSINFGSPSERDFFMKWFRDRTEKYSPRWIYKNRDRIKNDWLAAQSKFREKGRMAAKKAAKKRKRRGIFK